MSPGDIRLRLLVRRNGVPDVKLVWPCSPSDDLTIAKLLTDINDVIPLESNEWGLEDYTVELGDGSSSSFECLHFQLVARTLKDEDQVLIRPLLDGDLKRRRLSGRDQISVDGKHLLDGVAFGRPWLRVPRGRPMLEIPPRKRARLMYEFEDIDDEGDEEEEEEEDDEEDEDFIEEDDDSEDEDVDDSEASGASEMLQLENGGLFDEESEASSEGEDANVDDEFQLLRRDTTGGADPSTAAGRGEMLRGLLPTLNGTAALRLAFPLLSSRVIEKQLAKNENDIGQTYKVLLQSNHTALSFDEMMDRAVTGLLHDSSSSDDGEEPVPQAPPRPLIEEVDVGEPSSRIEELVSDSDTSSSGSSDSSDSDSDSDSEPANEEQSGGFIASGQMPMLYGIDVADSDENSESNFGSSDDEDEADSSSDSSDGSSSDSSDESEAPSIRGNGQTTQPSVDRTPSKAKEQPASPQVPPGNGLTRTQKRNARRRKAKQAQQQLLERGGNDALGECLNDLAARKAALLSTLGEDKADSPEPVAEVTAIVEPKESTKEDVPAAEMNRETGEPRSSESAPRRTKMDLSAGRRLLFGALGLKNPKSKADEQNLRSEMMKNVRPLQNKRLIEEVQDADKAPEGVQPDEAWRDKITYRAIECCHEGMELSEPPFPFVQRWDPQQQFNSIRKRKRQSQEFYDDYQDESFVYDEESAEAESGKQSKKTKKQQSEQAKEPSVDELNYDEVEPEERQDSFVADVDDLPALPADVSTLPVLNKKSVLPGMVITWQELSMSKATNWQPQMINKTALVLGGGGNDTLRVLLAKRDRDYNEKEYDEETGQRIYDRFEAPDFDEDEQVDAEDDGNRLLSWQQVMDPRIVQQAAPSNSNQANGIDSDNVDSQIQREIASTDQDQDHGHDSHPIQSAQHIPRLGSMSADDVVNSMTTDSWTSRAEEINQAACETCTSQTKQLGTTTDGVVEGAATTDMDAEVIADSNPLPVDHMPEFQEGLGTVLGVDEEFVIPESLPEACEKLGSPILGGMSPSSSPFPSIEEIYLTASLSKDSQPASETLSTAVKPTVEVNQEYDEAMQRLDNGHASDAEGVADVLFPNATQPVNRLPGSPVAPHPRSTPDRRAKRKAKEAFVVPDGSQVVDLLSSPTTSKTPKRSKAAPPTETGSESKTSTSRRGGKRASTSTAPPKTRRTTSYQLLQTGGESTLRKRRVTNK